MLDDRGHVRGELREILALMAEHGAILGTGHVEPSEVEVVAPVALEAGVPAVVAEQIRAVGFSSTILATDYGQPTNPPPVEGMRNFLSSLLDLGVPAQALRQMVQMNAAVVLGLA